MGRHRHKLLLYGPDVDENFLSNQGAALLKAITGEDPISPEYKNSIMVPAATPIKASVMMTANSRLRVRFQGDKPAWRRRLIAWAAKRLRVEPSKVRSARRGLDFIRLQEPLWMETKQAADLAVVEFLRQEELPIVDGKFGLLDMTIVIEKVKAVFSHLPKHVAGTLVLRVLGEYRKNRYNALVRGDHRMLSHKFGFPILISTGKWFPKPFEEGVSNPRIEVVLGKEEGSDRRGKYSNQRLVLELCGGKGYQTYLDHFKKLLSGEVSGGELALKAERAAGSSLSATQVFANLHLEMLVAMPQAAHGSLYVATDDKSFLCARVKDSRLWRMNADHLPKQFRALSATLAKVPRWVEQHDRRLQRFSDDLKFETRTIPSGSQAVAVVRARFVERQHNRINSFIEMVTAAVTEYACRRHYAEIVYNDSRRKTFGGAHFPWCQLELRLRQKAEARGMTFVKDENEKSLS
jgi:hypothetical protein